MISFGSDSLQTLTHLESLDISRCNQASTGWASLSGLTRLRSLRLFEVSRLKDNVLVSALQKLTGYVLSTLNPLPFPPCPTIHTHNPPTPHHHPAFPPQYLL